MAGPCAPVSPQDSGALGADPQSSPVRPPPAREAGSVLAPEQPSASLGSLLPGAPGRSGLWCLDSVRSLSRPSTSATCSGHRGADGACAVAALP